MDNRIWEHPIIDFRERRGKEIQFNFNGKPVKAYEGETIAAALYASGVKVFGKSIRFQRPRGWFCAIGKCSSCLMKVDGIPNVRTCITLVREGMNVEYQDPRPSLPEKTEFKREHIRTETDIAVIGGGPAGLSAVLSLSELGVDSLIIDENPWLGGQLIKQTHKFFGSKASYAGTRGIKIAEILLGELKKRNVKALENSSVIACYKEGEGFKIIAVKGYSRLYEINAKSLLVATGAMENMLTFPNNDLPGVCGAGGVQTLMNVYGVKPGENALMVGAGNVGLIVAYQLAQAGVNVKMIVEAAPRIGGYLVHAAKVRRMGIPILTRHSIKAAIGKDHVEGAVITKLDENWNPIEGTEFEVEVDLICLAVGLTPSTEILMQIGCEHAYIPELGGNVAIHDKFLKTTLDNVYLAGDVSGIEEASTAMMEGKVAAATAAIDMGVNVEKAERLREKSLHELELLRSSPFSQKVLAGKEKVYKLMEEIKGE